MGSQHHAASAIAVADSGDGQLADTRHHSGVTGIAEAAAVSGCTLLSASATAARNSKDADGINGSSDHHLTPAACRPSLKPGWPEPDSFGMWWKPVLKELRIERRFPHRPKIVSGDAIQSRVAGRRSGPTISIATASSQHFTSAVPSDGITAIFLDRSIALRRFSG